MGFLCRVKDVDDKYISFVAITGLKNVKLIDELWIIKLRRRSVND